MKKEYKLFNELRHGNKLQEALYINKYSLGLDRFLGSMISIEDWKKYSYNREQEFQITIDYLSFLLRNGELKMKTFEHYKKEHPQGKDGYVINTITPGKEWKQEEIEEGLQYIREKWNSFDDSRERESFESWDVLFTLPENEWVI